MNYESDTTCPAHNTSFIENDEHQDHDTHIPVPSEQTLQDHNMPIPTTNSPKHKQPAKHSSIPMLTTSTVNKTPSSLKANDAETTPMTSLPRPSTGSSTENSITEINPEPVKSNKKHTMPVKPANHTSPQATRQPLLPIPPASARINCTQQLLTRQYNRAINNQHFAG